MINEKGYYKIYRSMLTHEIWLDRPFNRGAAWVDLLGSAAWDDFKSISRDLKRGEIWTTIRFLSDRWGWSKDKVSQFLRTLKENAMIELRPDTKRGSGGTQIFILNYEKYQGLTKSDSDDTGHKNQSKPDTDRTQNPPQTGHKIGHKTGHENQSVFIGENKVDAEKIGHKIGHKQGHKTDTNKDYKEVKKYKNTSSTASRSKIRPYQFDPVAIYCEEFRRVRHTRAVILPPDAKAAHTVAQTLSNESVFRRVMRAFCNDPDVFLTRQGHSLRLLPSRINAYSAHFHVKPTTIEPEIIESDKTEFDFEPGENPQSPGTNTTP